MRAYEFLTEKQLDEINRRDFLKEAGLVESIERDGEILEEGIRDKILGAVAAAGIMLGGQAEADTVFVYQDANNQLVTVEEFMDVPDDAQMAYALDTETQKIKMIKNAKQTTSPERKQLSSVPNLQEDVEAVMELLKKKSKIPMSQAEFRGFKYLEYENGQRIIIGIVNLGKGPITFSYTPTGMSGKAGIPPLGAYDDPGDHAFGNTPLRHNQMLQAFKIFQDPMAWAGNAAGLTKIGAGNKWGEIVRNLDIDPNIQ